VKRTARGEGGKVVWIALAAAVVVSACTHSPDPNPVPARTTDPHIRRLPNGGVIWDRGIRFWLPPGTLVQVVNEGRDSARPELAAGVIDHAVVVDFDLYDPYCALADYQWKHVADPDLIQCAVPHQEGLVVADAGT
jgi:hypothetical protein